MAEQEWWAQAGWSAPEQDVAERRRRLAELLDEVIANENGPHAAYAQMLRRCLPTHGVRLLNPYHDPRNT